jgi:hypothetical protein
VDFSTANCFIVRVLEAVTELRTFVSVRREPPSQIAAFRRV